VQVDRNVDGNGVDTNEPARPAQPQGALTRDLTLYTVARLGLLAVVAGVLVVAHVPLLVALVVAVVVAMPLSLVVFRGLRARVTAGLAERGAARRAERDRLRAQLRGEEPTEGR
jgi:Flp pilus assembly protein TadB